MKKYMKPVIVFESFASSTNIAGDCERIVDSFAKGNCAVLGTGGISMFADSVSVCVFKSPQDYDGYCYHVPTEDKSLFNS